jgi:hypothetical protein
VGVALVTNSPILDSHTRARRATGGLPTRTNGEDRVPESHPTTPIFDELRRELLDDPPVTGDLDADVEPGADPAADEP